MTIDSHDLHVKKNEYRRAWAALLDVLHGQPFNEIKRMAGLGGMNAVSLATFTETDGSSKGVLLDAISAAFGTLEETDKKAFIATITEEVLVRNPDCESELSRKLERLGWGLIEGAVVPLELVDPIDLSELPPQLRKDLTKASQRFRDGDLSGAVSATCGAVDSLTERIYREAGLGDPSGATFQERCKKALASRSVIPAISNELDRLGWEQPAIKMFVDNLEGALNRGAYVMQSLRSRMGDVHGTKAVLRPLVFDCVKWADVWIRMLLEGPGPRR